MLDDTIGWDNTVDITFATEARIEKAPYADCTTCPLVAFPCVPSYKPSGTIELIAIGEAPSFYEVQQGKPFVGPSGKLLDAVLDHVGIDTTEVYKTNAVLCRPPDNKLDQYQDAITHCQQRLAYELAQVECGTIVALGSSAVQTLDAIANRQDKRGILARRGQWYALDEDRSYLTTLHPAFILRSTGYMSVWLQDMRSIKTPPDIDWRNITYTTVDATTRDTFIDALSLWYSEKRVVSFDVETHGLDPQSPLLELGFAADDTHAWIVPGALFREDESLREIINHFLSGARLVAHNGKFDQQVLTRNGIVPFNLTDDTMLMHYCLDEQKGTHDLKQVASSFLGVHDYESELVDTYFRNMKRSERDYSLIPQDKRRAYLTIDCCATLALQKLFDPMLDADNVRQAYQLRIAASNALQYTEQWGIKIDRQYLTVVHEKLTEAIGLAENDIQATASQYAQEYLDNIPSTEWGHTVNINWVKTVDQYRNVLLKIVHGDKKNTGINLSSWQQVQVLLYDVLKLKHIKSLGWKTDPRSTNAEALDALEFHPFVSVLQEYRRLDKIKGTYVEKLLTLADDNDRVHVRYNIHGTETGRLSANDGLHGIPRANRDQWGAAIRGAFIADTHVIQNINDKSSVVNYKLGKCDYAQAELRVFAALSNETFLLDMFRNGDDPHGNITLMVFHDDPRFTGMTSASYDKITEQWSLPQVDGFTAEDQKRYWKEKRTTGKNVVFGGLVYQGKAPGIVAMIRAQTGKEIDIKTVDYVLTSMLDQMPNAKQWQKDQLRHARDKGFVQTRLGMKRRFMLITEENFEDVRKACVNAPVQGVVAELLMIAATQLINQDVRILMLNHDELVFEAKEDVIEQTAALVKATMINVAAQYFPEVAWNADYSIGDRWYQHRPEF